ncbi:MAG: PorV/PorQ family protein [Chitinivibrionales bacterium]
MHNIRKIQLFVYLLLLLGIKLSADTQISHSSAGTTMFAFLDMGYDARSLAMGSADIGVKNDVSGVFSNPAALYQLARPKGLITYKPVIMDIRSGSFAYGFPLRDAGVVAVNMIYMSYGTVEGVDNTNEPTNETWRPYSVSGSILYATRILDAMDIGFSLKGIYDRIGSDQTYTSADGFALDAGWQYTLQEVDLSCGIILKNMGFVRSGHSDRDEGPLPFTVGSGISYRPAKVSNLLLAFDMEKTVGDYLEYAVGGEAELFDRVLMLRAGYMFSQRDLVELFRFLGNTNDEGGYQKTNWNTVSVGFGINTEVGEADMRVDAALNFRTDHTPPSYALTVQVGI